MSMTEKQGGSDGNSFICLPTPFPLHLLYPAYRTYGVTHSISFLYVHIVRANTTIARPLDESKKGEGSAYLLRGHKASDLK